MIGTKWVFKVKAGHTLTDRVVVQGWGQVACHVQSIGMALAAAASEDREG